nr:hypothetical protein 3 [Mute swan feces associated tombus-like virus 6]
MAPKRKPRASTSPPATGAGTGRRRNTPAPRPRPRRQPATNNTPRQFWTEWFVAWSGEVSTTSRQGTLDAITLHPQALPTTPYATALAHHTHRREAAWEIKVHCTSATNTGTRLGCFVLPDPTIIDGITPEMVWAAITNGLGAEINSVGITTRSRAMRVKTATNILSNALPGPGESHLGYASGTLILYLLDAPIGLTDSDKVRVVTLLRCLLTPHNAVPGFGLWESQVLSAPKHHPGPPDWTMTVTFAFSNQNNDPPMSSFQGTTSDNYASWSVKHVGNLPLAGGYYFVFAGVGGTAPTISAPINGGSEKSNVTIRGNPCSGRVYVSNSDFPLWQNNRGMGFSPKYFATIKGFFTHHVYMVGFVTQAQAANQADGAFTLIPGGAELCVRYAEQPRWSQFHPPNSTKQFEISFWSAYTSRYSADIYHTSEPVSGYSTATTSTTTYSMAQTDGPSTSGTPQQLSAAALQPTAPPYESEWESSDEEDEDEVKQALPAGRPYGSLTPDELAVAYQQALQVVDDLEEETRVRSQPSTSEQATQASGSWWELLKAALTKRRQHMA